VERRPDLPLGVETVRRGDYLFPISHVDRPVELGLGAKHLDLLTGTMVAPAAVLAPRDALVLVGEAPREAGTVPARRPKRDDSPAGGSK
jgi:hypothetical protein